MFGHPDSQPALDPQTSRARPAEASDPEQERLAAFYAARVAAHDQHQPGYADAWKALVAAVLAHGGRHVVPPMRPEDGATLIGLLTPEVRSGHGARLVPGQPSSCHGNSSLLLLRGEVAAIATGYGLSDDQLWRQHTWALDAEGRIVETTEPRLSYAGRVLSPADAVVFALENLDLDPEAGRELARRALAEGALAATTDPPSAQAPRT